MSWDLTGKRVSGLYMGGFRFKGVVTNSRVKYGGKCQHCVKLDYPVIIFGRHAEVLLIESDKITEIE